MSNATETKLVATNAALLTGAALLSFVLPMITESITDGEANFAKAMAQMVPLFAVVPLSSSLISKAYAQGQGAEPGE